MGILEFLSSMKTGIGEVMRPVTDSMDAARMDFGRMTGDVKTVIDDGDGSEREVFDREAFSDRMTSLAKASAAMSPRMPAPPSGAMRPPQVSSSPAPVMGAAPNPYAPVNYNAMQYGQQGGIGGAPTMEQILKALQSRGL
jgi:hypothetical protein